VVCFEHAFHGRTNLAMALTSKVNPYKKGFGPFAPEVYRIPYPYCYRCDAGPTQGRCCQADRAHLEQLFAAIVDPDSVAAIILELETGEGGFVPAPKPFVEMLAGFARDHGILFIADEIQTGFGRTGRMFAVEHSGVRPDVMVMAKGIGSGFPISAIGASAEVMARWPKGSHGGTYGGNPIGCAAALATIDVLTEPGFLDAVQARGAQLRSGLERAAAGDDGVREVRGLGLMVAVEFADASRTAAVQRHCLAEGHLILMTAGSHGNIIRFMPPLVVSAAEVDQAVNAFAMALKQSRR
jgi:4-aminobutyrate aminotransferase-like enzyme